MNVENKLESKTINEILNYNFFIPSYQRGYRWTEKQVKALLEDLWAFKENEPKKEDFYCLQPIVVTLKKETDTEQWELIDGQQRLTTIFILLNHFNNRLAEKYRGKVFSLHYKTREDSIKYLKDINEEDKDKNIDYHFIYEALQTIEKWFSDKDYLINDFQSVLLNKTRIIWYEVNDNSVNPIDIFTRINIGKIPLTNAELVKALFLQKQNFPGESTIKQLQIAAEWDTIEKKLQDNSFWFFIYSPTNSAFYENRIEYIFDLIKNKKRDDEEYFTFNLFSDQFEQNKTKEGLNIDSLWLEVKKYFLSLEEWYNDRDLYHMIGFLIEYKADINTLKKESSILKKSEFKVFLRQEIKARVSRLQLDTLEFGPNKREIKMLLLLFNVQTILATHKAEMRFPFDKYKSENWDIEHVNSQTDILINTSNRKAWAKDILEYFLGEPYSTNSAESLSSDNTLSTENEMMEDEALKVKDYISRLLNIINSEDRDDEYFEKLSKDLAREFDENDFNSSESDGISNLALLDAATNRSYGNAMFPIKRKRIIENDMNGIFVPICTKNLFLKYYSKTIDKPMHWQKCDANDYLKSIKHVLKDYLPLQTAKL